MIQINCPFNKDACVNAFSELKVEAQNEANSTGLESIIEYQLVVTNSAGLVQYYKVENDKPVKLKDGECGIIVATPSLEESLEEEVMDDFEIIFDEELVSENEEITEVSTNDDDDNELETLRAENLRLLEENAAVKEVNEDLQNKIVTLLENSDNSLVLIHLTEAKEIFKALDELNAKTKKFR